MYNKVILIGRLTATPEMAKTASDRSFTRVTVAVNRRQKAQNGEREADFITVVVWGRLAETVASYASKGSLISLDGELRTRKYEKDGQTHYVRKCFAPLSNFLRAVPNVLLEKISLKMTWLTLFWKKNFPSSLSVYLVASKK